MKPWLYVVAPALIWLFCAFLVWALIHGGRQKQSPTTPWRPSDPGDGWSSGQVVSEDETLDG